jgi:calcineurin-like phosphoesterase family protein
MTRVWFTSDTHLGHANIINYCNRPFDNIYHMNDTIIKRWNERVKEEDTVFHLGDLCFKEKLGVKAEHWIEQLNGKIILIRGNHDNNNSAKSVIDSLQITLGGKKWNLEHIPDYYSLYEYNLTGHVHTAWSVLRKKYTERGSVFVNVGVDVFNFYPVSIEEIMRRIDDYDNGRIE